MKRTKEKLCPIARVADIVGDYCTVLIIRDLVGGTKRFKELELSLELYLLNRGIHDKTIFNVVFICL